MGLLFVKTAEGRKKPSVWVWLTLLAVMLGASYFFVTNTRETGLDEMQGNTKEKQAKEAPVPVTRSETDKAARGMDAETANAMSQQIERERAEGNGFLAKNREQEIKEKYEKEFEQKQSANFRPSVDSRLTKMKENAKPTATPPPPPPIDKSRGRYKTLAERLAADGIDMKKGKSSSAQGMAFAPPKEGVGFEKPTPTPSKGDTMSGQWLSAANLLPLGTFLRCVLDGDVVTNNLTSYVWGNVVIDETFRRQMQLPKGLVKVRGRTAMEPVQNVCDIVFDTMVFSDGTELPISGFAYAAFDPRWPHRFRTRGVPGDMVVPPMWIKLQALILTAALGASDAYIQNYVNQNTETPSTWTSVPTTTTVNGVTTTTTSMVQNQGQPVNSNIGATVGLSAAQSAATELVTEIQKEAEKYKPYLIIEKGTPFFIQLDNTVDIGTRRINGTAIAKAQELERNIALSKQGVPMPKQEQVTYPPGDARAKYTGVAPTKESGMSQAQTDLAAKLNQMQTGGSSSTTTPTGSMNVQQLQDMLKTP